MAAIFYPEQHQVTKKLFADPSFRRAASSVCPPDKQVLDPFQTNLIAQLPGQTVAAHIDAVYFWGANRFQYVIPLPYHFAHRGFLGEALKNRCSPFLFACFSIPQWLLAVMAFSGIFQDRFIDQVQVVAYFREIFALPETKISLS